MSPSLADNLPEALKTPLGPLMGDGMFRHFRPVFRGPLIATVTSAATG
jgi:hypothetical protein